MRVQETPADPAIVRFGVFELDTRTGELRKAGALVKLQQQPTRVLALLVGRPRELITRQELRSRIWGGDTFVDFDQGLNFCIKQIRAALGDQADTPRFVETLPRRGYRFIAPTERAAADSSRPSPVRPLAFRPLAVEPPRPAASSGRWRRRPGVYGPAAAVLLLTVGASLFLWGRRTAAPPSPSFKRLTFRRGMVDSARFTPDGGVLYTAAWDGAPESEVFATREGASDTRAVGVAGVRLFSVMGTEMAVRLSRKDGNVLARVPVAGGPLREVLDRVSEADGSPDGSRYAVYRFLGERGRLEFPVGRVLWEPPGGITSLRLSPRGDRVAFLEHPILGDDRGSVVTVDAAGRRTVLSADWASLEGLAWAPGGNEVWFSGTRVGADLSLHAVSLDGRLRTLTRAPGRLVLHDVAPDGRALVVRSLLRFEVRQGTPGGTERDLTSFDVPLLVDFSADGRQLLFGESGEAGGPGYGIYLRGADGSLPVRLGEGRPWSLSPNGRWVASTPLKALDQIVLLPTGAGDSRTIVNPSVRAYNWVGWLPDSRRLLFSANESDRPGRLFVQSVEGGAPRPVTPEGVLWRTPVATPDGRFVVACPGPGKAFHLYPVDGGEPRPLAGLDAEDYPIRISGDGGALFVRRGGLLARIDRLDLATGQRQTLTELRPPDLSGVWKIGRVFATPDGKAYAYNFSRSLSELYLVEGLE